MKLLNKFCKFCKFYLYIFFLGFFFISNGISNDNITYIDINFLLDQSLLGKKIINEIQLKNEKNNKFLAELENNLKIKEEKILQTKNIISEEEFNKKITELKNQINTHILEKQKINSEFENFKQKKINDFFVLVRPIIENYMEQNSINLIIEKKYVFMGKLNNEISADIVKLINKIDK